MDAQQSCPHMHPLNPPRTALWWGHHYAGSELGIRACRWVWLLADNVRPPGRALTPSLDLPQLTAAWSKHRISTYNYLLQLNSLAGRQMHNPAFHPVFPWVLDMTAAPEEAMHQVPSHLVMRDGVLAAGFLETLGRWRWVSSCPALPTSPSLSRTAGTHVLCLRHGARKAHHDGSQHCDLTMLHNLYSSRIALIETRSDDAHATAGQQAACVRMERFGSEQVAVDQGGRAAGLHLRHQ